MMNHSLQVHALQNRKVYIRKSGNQRCKGRWCGAVAQRQLRFGQESAVALMLQGGCEEPGAGPPVGTKVRKGG